MGNDNDECVDECLEWNEEMSVCEWSWSWSAVVVDLRNEDCDCEVCVCIDSMMSW